MKNIDWENVAIKILIGIFFVAQIGFTLYAVQGMTAEEKTDFILEIQPE